MIQCRCHFRLPGGGKGPSLKKLQNNCLFPWSWKKQVLFVMAMFPSIKWLVLNVTAVKMTFPITLWSTMMLIPGKRAKKDNFPFLCGCFSYSLSTFYTMADGRWQVCDLCLQSCCHLWKTLNIWKYSLLVFFSSPCQDKCRCNHFSKACFLLSSPRDSIKMSEFQKKGECLVMFL